MNGLIHADQLVQDRFVQTACGGSECSFPFFARQGGLVSYGIDLTDLFRRSAINA
jgi:hypothetical protein